MKTKTFYDFLETHFARDDGIQVLDDDFSEDNGTVGVTFNLTNSSNITTLNYVTTSTGSSASFKHTIRTIR